MRILLTADPELPVPPPLYGGIERIVDWLARELVQMGHEVGLVAHRESTVEGVALFPWPGLHSRSPGDAIRNSIHLSKVVRHFQPDILHSFSRLVYLAPLATSRVPRVMSFQRLPTERTVAMSARLHGRRLVYTGCSEWISRVGRSAGGVWETIHNGVELSRYTFVGEVPRDAPLLFLSRLDRVKAPHTAIRIALADSRRIVVAGNFAERGPDREYFDKEVRPLLDEPLVEWVGPVDDVRKNELLGRSAALLVPIEWDEPFGIVFVEALACGTPVISNPRGAVPEIVRHGIEGFTEPGGEDLGYLARRAHLIDRSACRARVESAFSSSHIAALYSNLYERHAGSAVR
ncbi:glycosyltransferase [bacterium]|nr:glycosyltransferase [bacterium]